MKSILIATLLFVSVHSSAQSINHIYDAIRGEFNGDGYADLAYIVDNPNSEEYFELIIQLSTGEAHGSRYLAAHSTNLIYKVAGQFFSVGEPSLQIRKFKDGRPDSLAIHSEHYGIGRSKWAQDVVVAYRNGKFMFAGMDYSEYDAFQEYTPLNCSFNTLTGVKNYTNEQGKQIKNAPIVNSNVVRKDIESLVENDVIELISKECLAD